MERKKSFIKDQPQQQQDKPFLLFRQKTKPKLVNTSFFFLIIITTFGSNLKLFSLNKDYRPLYARTLAQI